ncbi:MAG: LemA family protein [Pelomonas sp.]|nr:LemA family protein [Roseateles sp.]
MNWLSLGALIFAAMLVFWGIGAYHRLMRLRAAIVKAFAQIEHHHQQRAELCDRLVAAVRPALPDEPATFDALATARDDVQDAMQAARAKPHAGGPVAQLAVVSAVHVSALTRLLSLIDHHAELRHDAAVYGLLEELKLVERQRSFARQVFNQAVAQYNEAQAQFPTRILAGLYGISEARSL